ncbi:unnamed protein product [Rangifer tarandus platyrhynchus]|uniref:Uncharacterized protein n=3 Tax=Rangifer tarandus platyrhynchus TaxID=3082113 RepID=A0ACB1KGU7_RANTA|nr:unnamed protein product [Rangifer tarandus platyrhynchus]
MQLAYPRRPVGGNAEALLEQKPLPSTCTYITFLIPLPKRFIFRAYRWQGFTVKSPGKKISILDTCFFFFLGPRDRLTAIHFPSPRGKLVPQSLRKLGWH